MSVNLVPEYALPKSYFLDNENTCDRTSREGEPELPNNDLPAPPEENGQSKRVACIFRR
jgi:hypothetical protein